MLIEGKIDVTADRQRLWDFLLDLERFSSCLPGIGSVAQVDTCVMIGERLADFVDAES